MNFASDNAGPAHPAILEALGKANEGHAMGYGRDPLSARAVARLRETFEAPEASVHLVTTGTAANALILATLANPWSAIFCSREAHIEIDECNAPEFFTGGAKLRLVGAEEDKFTAEELDAAIRGPAPVNFQNPQPGAVSITQLTERGTLYSLDEIRAIARVSHAHGLPLHLDGARFANAAAALGCSAAEMTWKAGVDAVSFGGTKNGCLAVEAAVFFDPAHAREFALRRKQGGHLLSKHRYLSAQMDAYLEDDLWLDLAQRANRAAGRLARSLAASRQVRLTFEVGANMIFFEAPRRIHRRLMDEGARYYIEVGEIEGDDPDAVLTGRLVTDWSVTDASVDAFLAALGG